MSLAYASLTDHSHAILMKAMASKPKKNQATGGRCLLLCALLSLSLQYKRGIGIQIDIPIPMPYHAKINISRNDRFIIFVF